MSENKNEKRETVADIADEIRRAVESMGDDLPYTVSAGTMRRAADRVEAAWRREREELERYAASKMLDGATIVDNRKGGNAAAMREALEFAARQLVDATESDEYGDDVVYLVGCMRTVAGACRAALAAPARQCDIGTAEEQKERFDEFCNNHWGSNDRSGNNCGMCPLSPINCLLEWAQMPYEAEEGGTK